MNVLIRNIDVVSVKKIDKLAKKEKMSRNEYLRNQIEKLAWVDELQKERRKIEEAFQIVSDMLSRIMRIMQEQQDELEKMKTLFMMLFDLNEEELEQFIYEFTLTEGDTN